MSNVGILPVMDVKAGQAVAAVGGERSSYQPVRGVLTPSSAPMEVACALVQAAGTVDLYSADLDALEGGEPQWPVWRALAAAGLRLWLDAAIHDEARLEQVLAMPNAIAIVASESLLGLSALPRLAAHAGTSRLAFSLDLRDGSLYRGPRGCDALTLAAAAVQAGFPRLIVLDLAAVGTLRGPFEERSGHLELCRELHRRWPHPELLTGGGIRDPHDLRAFGEAGVNRVLVATALHRGVWFSRTPRQPACRFS